MSLPLRRPERCFPGFSPRSSRFNPVRPGRPTVTERRADLGYLRIYGEKSGNSRKWILFPA
jgi:ribosomal protein L19